MGRHDLRISDELTARVKEMQARYGLISLNAALSLVVTKGVETLETWSVSTPADGRDRPCPDR